MGLLDGNVSAIFGSVLGSFYLDGVLYKARQVFDAYGDVEQATLSVPCKLQIDSVTERLRSNPAFTAAEVRILVLAAPLGKTTVTSDDMLMAKSGPWTGIKWKLNAPIGLDTAGVGYDCAGVRA